jgi:molecular chaperone HscB
LARTSRVARLLFAKSILVLDFSQNHFVLFGLPETFKLDKDLLAKRYRSLQRALHPDRSAASGDREKRLSMQASTRVNEAYDTLRDPLARARYLLLLRTGDAAGDNETTSDMNFLMEQMELRELLAAAKGRADPYSAVEEVSDRLDLLSNRLVEGLSDCLDAPTRDRLDQARELIRKLQFVDKCRAEAERVEEEIDGAS